MTTALSTKPQSRWLKKIYALPAEHGAWALWLGPLAVGIGAGGWNGAATGLLLLAQLGAFLARQPLVILVKAFSGRRSRNDGLPALAWLSAYTLLAALFGLTLIGMGYTQLLLALIPIAPMLLWQVWLVRERAERQMTIELAGSGIFALAAPTAYYVATGVLNSTAVWLWVLCWVESAAAIVYVYLRLAQRRLAEAPPMLERWRMGRRAIVYATANLIGAAGLALIGAAPPSTPFAFAPALIQAIGGTREPCVGVKPQRIGFAQVAAMAIFAGLLIVAYRV
ncbi:MAG TPA: YwiC-like family protein [Anaerolineae bacterium]|nr:YwiC-like family protein [Anaerolineae bacterium]